MATSNILKITMCAWALNITCLIFTASQFFMGGRHYHGDGGYHGGAYYYNNSHFHHGGYYYDGQYRHDTQGWAYGTRFGPGMRAYGVNYNGGYINLGDGKYYHQPFENGSERFGQPMDIEIPGLTSKSDTSVEEQNADLEDGYVIE